MTPATTADPPLSRRERYRAQTCAEIKEEARRQIAEAGGAGSLSLNALARSLGMAGPSLYRYFASRDALLTELLVDAFTEQSIAIEGAVGEHTSPEQQLRAYAAAYREWALTHPGLYELLYGTPVPGFVASLEDTGSAAAHALAALAGVIGRLRSESGASAPAPAALRPNVRWSALLAEVPHADRTAFVLAVRAWTRLHGILSLEMHAHTTQILDDPEALYAAEVDDVIAAAQR